MVHFSRPVLKAGSEGAFYASFSRARALEDAAGAAGRAVREDEEAREGAPPTGESAALSAAFAAALSAVEANL